jgi:hypothetical protein
MSQKQYLKDITPAQFDKFTSEEKMKFITEESLKFAQLVIGNIQKWKGADSVKCLGLLQASIILHKMRGFVDDDQFLFTTKEYLENMVITQNAAPANGGKNEIPA